ncbi:DMT family transporter [Fibrobacterota bacterium]
MNLLLLLFISVVWGSSFILIKRAALCFGPVSIAAYRVICGAVVILVVWVLVKRRSGFSRHHFVPLMALSLIGYVVPFVIQPFLISRYESGFISMVVCLIPIITIMISIPMLKKLPNRYELTGVAGGLMFLMILFKDGLERDFSVRHLMLWLLVPFCYSFGNTFVRMKFKEVEPLALSGLALAVTGTILLPAGITLETVSVSGDFVVSASSLLVLGVASTGMATGLFYILLYRTGPVSAGMLSYVIPCVALVWGWWDGEPITMLQLIALAGILGMVALAQKGAASG